MKITMKCLLALLLMVAATAAQLTAIAQLDGMTNIAIGTKPLLKLDKSRQATHTDYNPNGLSRIMKYNISQKQ